MSVYDVRDRIALVTGGARGLGAGMAKAPTAAGARVMIADVLKDVGEQTAAELDGGRFVPLDVTDDSEWDAAVAHTVSEFGGLDIVINNAGIEVTQLIVDTEPEAIRRMLDINILGSMLGIKHAFRAMRPGGAAGRELPCCRRCAEPPGDGGCCRHYRDGGGADQGAARG